MQCIQCNKVFEAKRSTAKYCSAKCRKLAFLENGKKVSVPESVRPIITKAEQHVDASQIQTVRALHHHIYQRLPGVLSKDRQVGKKGFN